MPLSVVVVVLVVLLSVLRVRCRESPFLTIGPSLLLGLSTVEAVFSRAREVNARNTEASGDLAGAPPASRPGGAPPMIRPVEKGSAPPAPPDAGGAASRTRVIPSPPPPPPSEASSEANVKKRCVLGYLPLGHTEISNTSDHTTASTSSHPASTSSPGGGARGGAPEARLTMRCCIPRLRPPYSPERISAATRAPSGVDSSIWPWIHSWCSPSTRAETTRPIGAFPCLWLSSSGHPTSLGQTRSMRARVSCGPT